MAAKKENPVLWSQKEHAKPKPSEPLGELLIDAVRSGNEIRVRDALQKGADINYMCQAPTHVSRISRAFSTSRSSLLPFFFFFFFYLFFFKKTASDLEHWCNDTADACDAQK
jgi:hypothetical protein